MNSDPEGETNPRAREVFLAALEIDDPIERNTFLDGECDEDAKLRTRVESLLAAIEDATISKPLDDLTGLPAMTGSTLAGSTPGRWEPPLAEEVSAMLDAYEVTEILGRGGMGAVYKGVQSSLDRPVAIKLLPPELGSDAEFEARFRREAKSMARLNHPNIVQIYDFGEAAEGYHYIVMEFVEGTDLQHLIRSGKLDTDQALRAVGQICDALEYAHGEGYVHRDIKPANIFLNQSGTVKVGDFGLAKLVGDEGDHYLSREIGLTRSGMAMGTPHYIAPEQLENGAKVDRRADIYSLGVMFYEMLTGQIPRGSVRPPSERVKNLDVRIDEIVFKAMEHDPDERYQSAIDLHKEVETVQLTEGDFAGRPARKHRDNSPSRSKKSAEISSPSHRPRQKSTVISIAAVLVVLVVGAFYSVFHDRGGDPKPEVTRENGTTPDGQLPGQPEPDVTPPVGEKKLTETVKPPKSRVPVTLPVPTRDLPDLATLPRGRVKTFGKTLHGRPLSAGDAADFSDFVEVMLRGGDGWFGLRANGDVYSWKGDRGGAPYREGMNVRTLGRTSSVHSGEWLSETGDIVERVSFGLLDGKVPPAGIADIALSRGNDGKAKDGEYTLLNHDGSLIYLGTGTPPPVGTSDFVRIDNANFAVFGIRESGELSAWGEVPDGMETVRGVRFAKLSSSGFHLLALTVEGVVWRSVEEIPAPFDELNAEGPMIDIVCGWNCYAARRADGTWFGWSNNPEARELVETINSLGPNVPSLSFYTGESAVWIETGD